MATKLSPIENELNEMLERVFGDDDRTKEIMQRHNGFNCKRREKLEDIAKGMGVTKEAVRQRSIKGLDRLNQAIKEAEIESGSEVEVLKATRYGSAFLEVVAPCSESDAQMLLYNEGLTNLEDFDIEALIYLLDVLSFPPGIQIIKEGDNRFIVRNERPDVIRQIVKKAREEVTHHGAGDIVSLSKQISSGHQRIENQVRCVVAALEAQPDFVWLTEDHMEGSVTNQRTGYFLLKDAGRNPVELRLKRIFYVREKSHEKWIHAKIARSRKAMQRDLTLPIEVIRRIGIEKGICVETDQPHILKRAADDLDPKFPDFEYELWNYLVENPESADKEIMEACAKREQDKFNIRSKLNFSVVIQRVRHGVYTAVTDDFPPLDQVTIQPKEGG